MEAYFALRSGKSTSSREPNAIKPGRQPWRLHLRFGPITTRNIYTGAAQQNPHLDIGTSKD
jgi:hypothetical protein